MRVVDFFSQTHSLNTPTIILEKRGIGKKSAEFEVSSIQSEEDPDKDWLSIKRSSKHYTLSFSGLVDFCVSVDGRVIRGFSNPDTPDLTLNHLAKTQVLPLAMSLREDLVLHASSVETEDGVLAFIGEGGVGKSTMVAALSGKPYKHFSDDSLILDFSSGSANVVGDCGEIRLWDDSIEHIGVAPELFEPSVHYNQKLKASLRSEPTVSSPLLGIMELWPYEQDNKSPEVMIEELSGQEALMVLLKSIFRMDPTDKLRSKKEFNNLNKLLELAPIFRLTYPHDYNSLPKVKDAIKGHLEKMKSSYGKAAGL